MTNLRLLVLAAALAAPAGAADAGPCTQEIARMQARFDAAKHLHDETVAEDDRRIALFARADRDLERRVLGAAGVVEAAIRSGNDLTGRSAQLPIAGHGFNER